MLFKCKTCLLEVTRDELAIHKIYCKFAHCEQCGNQILSTDLAFHKQNDCLKNSQQLQKKARFEVLGNNSSTVDEESILPDSGKRSTRYIKPEIKSTNTPRKNGIHEDQVIPDDIPTHCTFCNKSVTFEELNIHPYVPHQFDGSSIYHCKSCLKTYNSARNSALKKDAIILEDNDNEEICALCAGVSKDDFYVCSDCPRSYCRSCLNKVLTTQEMDVVELPDEDWSCMCCAKGRVKTRGRNRGVSSSSSSSSSSNKKRTAVKIEEDIPEITVLEYKEYTYTGQVNSAGQKCGQGKLEYKFDQRVYEGCFADGGRMCGQGKMTYADGSVYEGRWAKSRPHGRGVLTSPSGEVMSSGVWKKGVLVISDPVYPVTVGDHTHQTVTGVCGPNEVVLERSKSRYIGAVNKRGEMHGKGRVEFSTGDLFVGMFANNMREGMGCHISSTAGTYTGMWVRDKRQGLGKLVYSSGEMFEGQFSEGRFQGHGKMTMLDGSSYEGSWLRSKQNGRGVWTTATGERTEGVWKDGLCIDKFCKKQTAGDAVTAVEPTGSVTIISGKNRYTGEVNGLGQKHGRGRLEYVSGNLYEGEFQNDLRHGVGTLQQIHDNGKHGTSAGIYSGQWELDKKQGQGVFTSTDGERYEGQFYDGRRHGHGSLTLVDGTTWTGKWQRGHSVEGSDDEQENEEVEEGQQDNANDNTEPVGEKEVVIDEHCNSFVRKVFGGDPFFGLVMSYSEPYYKVVYEYGDCEDLTREEMFSLQWKDAVPMEKDAACRLHSERLEKEKEVMSETSGDDVSEEPMGL